MDRNYDHVPPLLQCSSIVLCSLCPLPLPLQSPCFPPLSALRICCGQKLLIFFPDSPLGDSFPISEPTSYCLLSQLFFPSPWLLPEPHLLPSFSPNSFPIHSVAFPQSLPSLLDTNHISFPITEASCSHPYPCQTLPSQTTVLY